MSRASFYDTHTSFKTPKAGDHRKPEYLAINLMWQRCCRQHETAYHH